MPELPDNNADEARRWLVQAAEELAVARLLASDSDLPPRIACFHAHLAAEKSLKAMLISASTAFPKTHDLARLHGLLAAETASSFAILDLEVLDPWWIEGRYPDDAGEASATDAAECVGAAARILETAVRYVQ